MKENIIYVLVIACQIIVAGIVLAVATTGFVFLCGGAVFGGFFRSVLGFSLVYLGIGLFYLIGYGLCYLLTSFGGWITADKEHISFLAGEDFPIYE